MSQGSVTLVGFMGAGKSTLGPRLAARAALPFVDLDHRIVGEQQRPVAAIFAEQGEDAFRALEARHLAETLAAPVVVAAGGGVVEAEANRRLMREHSTVLWLDARLETVRARLRGPEAASRPLFTQLTAAALAQLYRRRRQLYAATAHFRFECDDVAPTELVRAMMRTLQEQG